MTLLPNGSVLGQAGWDMESYGVRVFITFKVTWLCYTRQELYDNTLRTLRGLISQIARETELCKPEAALSISK